MARIARRVALRAPRGGQMDNDDYPYFLLPVFWTPRELKGSAHDSCAGVLLAVGSIVALLLCVGGVALYILEVL